MLQLRSSTNDMKLLTAFKTDAVTIFTFVIALAALSSFFVSFFMWQATIDNLELNRQVNQSVYRPYVGLADLVQAIDNEQEKMVLEVRVRNFGTVPATVLEHKWVATIDGAYRPSLRYWVDEPQVIWPLGVVANIFATTGPEEFYAVTSGKSTLEIIFEIKYQGVAQETYRTYQKHRFDHRTGSLHSILSEWD